MYYTFTSPMYETQSQGSGRVCPLCGARDSDIISTGKVGCAKCYDVFADMLDPYIYRIFGDARHMGRVPGGVTPEILKVRELSRLKIELKAAIAEENYEQAAVLRDEIARIEWEAVNE